MADVRDWLNSLGLGQYADAFEENAVELSQLVDLDHEVLLAIGVSAAGHRMKILKAAAGPPPSTDEVGSAQRGSAAAEQATVLTEPERRQLTVMFCDLVGSVELGEQMEVERYRDLLGTFRTTVVGVVEQCDGFIARHLGDGLLVYFGYPLAKEDDAERAVRAGLGIVAAVAAIEHSYEAELKVRVGIATGLAVVGDVLSTGLAGRQEFAALGPTPNLAARLQAEASENTVVISETTRRLVGGFFELETLPPRPLKGIAGKTKMFRVRAYRAERSRFAARTQLQLSPFLGRQEELELLGRRWKQVLAGRGQCVLFMGEPGIGKSRLLTEFVAGLGLPSSCSLLFQSAPHLSNSALHSIVRALEEELELTAPYSDDALERLEAWLASQGLAPSESTGLLAELLSLPTGGRSFADEAATEPQQRREHLFDLLVQMIVNRAAYGPTVCIFEDLHWADPSTREFLERLVESVDRAGVLVLSTARPGFSAPWTDLPNVRVLSLSRLGPEESERLAGSVLEDELPWINDLLEDIVGRAGGNPLFIEELTRAVMLSGATSPGARVIPATLQDSLMARLDGLPAGKTVAQWASVIGREFDEAVLRAAWEGTAEALEEGLKELRESGLLQRRGESLYGAYRFKHALVRDAAYDSMLSAMRQSRHARVLQALEESRPEPAPEILAHHATEAHAVEQAVDYWEKAGRAAAARSANREAIEQLRRGISLLEDNAIRLPETELALWSALGPLLMIAEGDASQSAEEAFGRALLLAQELASPAEVQYPLAWGQWYMHMQRGSRLEVEQLAERLERISAKSGRSDLEIETHHSLWTFNMHYGELDVVRESAASALALYDEVEHRDLRFQFANHDPRMCAFFHLAMAETVGGRLQRAEEAVAEALRWSLAIEHLPTIAIARLVPLVVAFWKGDSQGVRATSQAFMDACDAVGAHWYRAVGVIFDGWAEAVQAPDGAAHRRVAHALSTVQATGQITRMPMYYTALAESLWASGERVSALSAAEEAIKSCNETGQKIYEPQAWNTFGVIQRGLAADTKPRVEQLAEPFMRGLSTAAAMGTPLLAIHPAISLAELYRECGRPKAGVEVLVPLLEQLRAADAPIVARARALLASLI